MFTLIKRRKIYSSKWIELYVDSIKDNDINIDNFHVLHYPKESVVVLLKKGDSFLFVKALRYITKSEEIELPAGNIEDGESAIDAAKREVFEETGIMSKNLKVLGSFYPSNGMSDQIIHVVGAEYNGGNETVQKGETTEILWFSKSEIVRLIQNDTLKDGVTMAAMSFQN